MLEELLEVCNLACLVGVPLMVPEEAMLPVDIITVHSLSFHRQRFG